MRPLPRPDRRRLVVGFVIGALVVVAGLAAAVEGGLLLHDTSRPTSVEDALRRFRVGHPHPGALEGVYLYTTRGGESVDALGGAQHRYPETTTITAVAVPCGLRLRWEALDGRSTTWRLCTTPSAIELRASEEVHRFFGRTDRTSYTCRGGVLRSVRETAGASPFRCRSRRGGETGTARVVGLEQIAVDGEPARAVHVRTAGRVTGGDSGTETIDWWLDSRGGVPLRIVLTSRTSRPSLLGRVHYREDADLRLASASPLR